MALSLTCVCGARFELDDTLAGQNVSCPECQQALKAPTLQSVPLRTSGLALASIVLCLVGAFTVIGTVMAVVLGFLALVSIGRQRERLAGVGLALFGIIAGSAFTGLTLFALLSGELFGFAGKMREGMLADQVDLSGPLEIVDKGGGFAITRPSKKWGQVPQRTLDDPMVRALQRRPVDLLLVQTERYVLVDVRRDVVNNFLGLEQCEQSLLEEFQPDVNFGQRQAHDLLQPNGYTLKNSRNLDAGPGIRARELEVEVVCGQRWQFLIRLYHAQGQIYVVRAFAQGSKRFKDARPELVQVLDSFRVLPTR